MENLKVVCIGAGYFAQFHLDAWNRIPEVKVVAICDLNLDKAKKLADKFNVDVTYTSMDMVYEKVQFDILDIITPPDTHLFLCRQAISKNKHIICQKPLAPDFENATLLASEVNQSNIKFMVHENFRFQPWYRKIKHLLQKGAIGHEIFSIFHRMRTGDGWSEDAYLARQPYFRQMQRFLIHETAIHFIDVFRYLLGDIVSVYAKLRKLNKSIRGEDAGIILFEFASGTTGIFDGNRYNEQKDGNPRYTFGEMILEGNEGSLRLDTNGAIFLKKLGEKEIEVEYKHQDVNFAGDCVYFTQRHFVDNLLSNTSFETNVNDYIKNLKIQESIYESASRNHEIKV